MKAEHFHEEKNLQFDCMERSEGRSQTAETLVTVLEEEDFGRALDEMEAQRVRAPRARQTLYRSPCERNRLTGSAIGIACRLNIQRATAKPIAA